MVRSRIEEILKKVSKARVLSEGELCDLREVVGIGIERLEESGLPEQVMIKPEAMRSVDKLDDDEIIEFIANYLSDNWGYCVNSFKWYFKDGFFDDPIIVSEIDWDITE